MANSAEEVKHLIKLLEKGGHSQVSEANAFLLQFVDTEAAWLCCIHLLRCHEDNFVQYFAANMLLTKIRKHWTQLSNPQQVEIFQKLCHFIEEYTIGHSNEAVTQQQIPFMKTMVNRFALMLASACCQYQVDASETSGVENFITLITGCDHLSPGAMLPLDVLAVLPSVIEEIDVSRGLRNDLNTRLSRSAPFVFKQVEKLISGKLQPQLHETIALLRMVRAWGPKSGLTLTSLAQNNPPLLEYISSCLRSTESSQVLSEAVMTIESVIQVNEYPRPALRNSVVNSILKSISGSSNSWQSAGSFDNPSLQYLLTNTGNESDCMRGNAKVMNTDVLSLDVDQDASNDICQSISSMSFCELDFIVSEPGFLPNFASLLLALTAMRPRKFSLHVFEFWIAMEDSCLNSRHEFFRRECFHALTHILIDQLTYPYIDGKGCEQPHNGDGNNYYDDEHGDEYFGDEEVEDVMSYRKVDQGLQDVFKQCIDSLGSDAFFEILSQRCENSFALFGENASPSQAPDWRSIEAVLFVLAINMDTVRQDSEERTVSEQAHVPVSVAFLFKVLQRILSPCISGCTSAYECLPTLFFSSSCDVLSASTFLLTATYHSNSSVSSSISSPFSGLFHKGVEFLFYALSTMGKRSSRVAASAAQGLLRLSTHGLNAIIDKHNRDAAVSPIMNDIVSSTASLFSSPLGHAIPIKSAAMVLQSVTVLISSSPEHHRNNLLVAITNPLLASLEDKLCSSRLEVDETVRVLRMISQIVRYLSPLSNDLSSSFEVEYIVNFFGTLWPLLDQLSCRVGSCDQVAGNLVLGGVFDVYKNAATNMSHLLLQQPGVLEDISQKCILGFYSRKSTEAIDCAAGLVESFPTSASTSSQDRCFVLLAQMLSAALTGVEEGFTQGIWEDVISHAAADANVLTEIKQKVRSVWHFGNDPELMGHFFNFLYQYFLCSPQILVYMAGQSHKSGNSIVDVLMRLLLSSLFIFNERDTVRKVLLVLQCIMIPAVGGDSLNSMEHNNVVMIPALRYADILLRFLFVMLDQDVVQTGVLPSLSETLYSVLVVCDENAITAGADWLRANLLPQHNMPSSLLLPAIPSSATERETLCSSMLYFVCQRNSRKFKTLISDVYKVCNGEMDLSAIHDYKVNK